MFEKMSDAEFRKWQDDLSRLLGGRPKEKGKPRKQFSTGLLKRLLIRSAGHCEGCGASLVDKKVDIHHKNSVPDDNRESNLMVICKSCHKRWTGPPPIRKRDAWA